MSTTESLLLGFGALIVLVLVWYFYLRSNWEYWKEYFRSTRKYYWAEVLIGVSSFICIWSFIPSGRIERL